jgi:predicted CoA-binding protein
MKMTFQEKIDDFLSQKHIAVAGVSGKSAASPANSIYKKLRESGYKVYAVNPNTETTEGDSCYPNLKSTPVRTDGVVIVTRPEVSEDIVKECADIGIKRVWLHNSFGRGSVSNKATQYCKENNISVISGACPMMYVNPVDFGHKCMRWILDVFGKLPK